MFGLVGIVTAIIPAMIASKVTVFVVTGIGFAWFVVISFIIFGVYLFDKVFDFDS